MRKKPKISNLDTGYLSEKIIETKFIERGFLTLNPLAEAGVVDLVLYKNKKFVRLQVKTAIFSKKENRFSISLYGSGRRQYKKNDFDYYVFYLYEVDTIYIVPLKILLNKVQAHFYPTRNTRVGSGTLEKYKNAYSQLDK